MPSESVGHGKRVGIVYVGKCLINEYIYEGCSKFFSVETVLFAKNKFTFAKL